MPRGRASGIELDGREQHQRGILQEVETYIPRGSRAPFRGRCRCRFYFIRSRRLPFELVFDQRLPGRRSWNLTFASGSTRNGANC